MYLRICKYVEKMSGVNNPKNSLGNAVKIYLFPALVTVLATLIWRDVTEMRTDIKMLLAQSNIDKTDIQNLKRDVQMLNNAVFFKTKPVSKVFYPKSTEFLYAKHEEPYHLNVDEKQKTLD
jgi:hypothetical protein